MTFEISDEPGELPQKLAADVSWVREMDVQVGVVLAGIRGHDQQAEVSLVERLRHHRRPRIGPLLEGDITENATQLRPSSLARVLPFPRSQGFVNNERPRVMFKVHL